MKDETKQVARAQTPETPTSDDMLLQALSPLAPRPEEQRDAAAMFLSFQQRMTSQEPQQRDNTGWHSWKLASIGVTLLAAVLWFPLSEQLSHQAVTPSPPRITDVPTKRPSTPPKGRSHGELTPKGQAPKQLQLRLLSKASSRWQVVVSGTKLPRKSKLAVSFHLQEKGGFVTVLWARPQREFSILYQSQHALPARQWRTIRKRDLVVQFPLAKEAPGQVFLFLLQSPRPLSPQQVAQWRKQFLSTKEAARFFARIAPQTRILASRPFSLRIARTPKGKQL